MCGLKTTSKQRARAKLVKMEESLSEGDSTDRKSDMEIEEFTNAYRQHIEGVKRPYTIKSLRHYWTHFVEWADPIQLSDLTPNVIEDYKRQLLRKGYAKSTVRSTLLGLSSVFSTAIKEIIPSW